MILSIRKLNEKDIDACYDLDSNTISLWSKKQWIDEFKKEGVNVFGLLLSNFLVGICVFQIVLDEAQINFFVVDQKYRKKGFGSLLMLFLIKQCELLSIKKLFLEVSHTNFIADRFYSRFEFSTVGIRRKYYKDGSDALIKEKILTTK